MRTPKTRAGPRRDLLRQIERLERLPLRAGSSRFVLDELGELATEPDAGPSLVMTTRWRAIVDLDPGWALLESRSPGPLDPLAVVADTPWWPAREDGIRTRIWRHSVAVSLAAHRLACEQNDPEPCRVARAGLLHGLGLWVVAAIDPERLTRWFQLANPALRQEFEIAELGSAWSELGRDLAQRWGCDPLVVDACWLHADLGRGLEDMATDPARLTLIQQAYALAERTPWSMSVSTLTPTQKERLDSDPKVRQLIAEVQARCGAPFVEEDAALREERLTRSIARLRRENALLSASNSARGRLLNILADSEPTESPEAWSERAGFALCQTPGVSVAHVGSIGDEEDSGVPERAPTIEYPLTPPDLDDLRIRLWGDAEVPIVERDLTGTLPAWRAWATLIVDRSRVRERLAQVVNALRMRADSEEPRLRASKLNALAEFAAGAGHELNNPLAVIVGRAQLLLVGETDPQAIRGLRAILTQAQRAHRILRDLMYVARPPELRPKFCLPDEILKASLRDASTEAEERGVKLGMESTAPATRVWADPDGLRHLADALVRNALEATPRGGSIRVCAAGDAKSLRWTLHDSGDGITPARAAHMFDPFYCGRAAGRGLGLGLPRASRFISAAGGTLEWKSIPGQGSTFEARIPLTDPPRSPSLEASSAPLTVVESRATSPRS